MSITFLISAPALHVTRYFFIEEKIKRIIIETVCLSDKFKLATTKL